MAQKLSNAKIRMLCEGAVMIAVAWALSYLELDLWFQGGSIGLTMIPLIIFAVRWGLGWGMVCGLVFGTLKFFLAGGFAIGWASILLDYTLAYMMVGTAGVFKGKKWGFVCGAALGGFMRFIIHFISGITIYATYMPESFMGITMDNVWIYSALYNGGYILPSTVLAVLACWALTKPLQRIPTK